MRYFRMRRVVLFFMVLIMYQTLIAQTPTHYPTGQNKVDFDFVNILIYVVFPVLLVVIWRLIRKRRSQD